MNLSSSNVFCSFIAAFLSGIVAIYAVDDFWIFIYPAARFPFVLIIALIAFWLSLKYLPKKR